MSNTRRQIEAWLKTIDVRGSVADIGGLYLPVRGRTKSWDVDTYHIFDVRKYRNKITADFVFDFNCFPPPDVCEQVEKYDVAFCIEVADHFWNPVAAFSRINFLLKKGGLLYLSTNFLFPHHTGHDCIRYTIDGLKILLTDADFEIISYIPKYAKDKDKLAEVMKSESKVYYSPGEIGYLVTARKIR